MRDSYEAYIKEVNGVPLYFVKHILLFPEYTNVEPVLQGYGMHADFDKACSIAGIHDPLIRKSILSGSSVVQRNEAKLIDIADYRVQKQLSR